jgi:hypothetical protein
MEVKGEEALKESCMSHSSFDGQNLLKLMFSCFQRVRE